MHHRRYHNHDTHVRELCLLEACLSLCSLFHPSILHRKVAEHLPHCPPFAVFCIMLFCIAWQAQAPSLSFSLPASQQVFPLAQLVQNTCVGEESRNRWPAAPLEAASPGLELLTFVMCGLWCLSFKGSLLLEAALFWQ